MSSCSHQGCTGEARWLHDGRPLCRSHATTELIRTGRPGTQIPAETLEERLASEAIRDQAERIDRLWEGAVFGRTFLNPMNGVDEAAEIRLLEGLVEKLSERLRKAGLSAEP